MVKVTYKGETRNIPKRYLPDSLTETQRKKQIKSIFEKKERPEAAYYSSGSRPNQSASSWAYGRIYAYIMGGDKIRNIENNITKKYKVKFQVK